MRTVLLNAGPLAHLAPSKHNDSELISVEKAIIIKDGVIEEIKDSIDALDEFGLPTAPGQTPRGLHVIDLGGKAVVPGFVDAHTHLLWAGDRSQEVGWRQKGLTYTEIASRGGGIRHTVERTRQATEEELIELGYVRLREALRTGTTHLETKSGYGLNTDSELRLLKIADHLGGMENTPSIDATWMGAHDVPHGSTPEAYVESVIAEQLPAVIEQGIARSADVFCEPGWFSVEQSEDILSASKHHGLSLRMHIDEFVDGGGGELAASLGAVTADHAYHTQLDARLNMKEKGVITGFLPGTPYAMGDSWPDMDLIQEHDIPFTLATDFNPNCRTLSLPFMCSLMVQRCGMSPLSALRAVTSTAAQSTPHPSGLPHGVIKEGAVANLNIVDGPHWELATLSPTGTPFAATILNGQLITH